MTPGARKWSPNGTRIVPRSWLLRFSWNLVSVQRYMVFGRFYGFWRPRPAPGTFRFCLFCSAPQKTTRIQFVSRFRSLFGSRSGGGITHLCGLLAHHFRTECEFSKFTPTKHIVFEPISGARVHLGPPGPKMGPGHPPRSPNDHQNMIFYSFLSISG